MKVLPSLSFYPLQPLSICFDPPYTKLLVNCKLVFFFAFAVYLILSIWVWHSYVNYAPSSGSVEVSGDVRDLLMKFYTALLLILSHSTNLSQSCLIA